MDDDLTDGTTSRPPPDTWALHCTVLHRAALALTVRDLGPAGIRVAAELHAVLVAVPDHPPAPTDPHLLPRLERLIRLGAAAGAAVTTHGPGLPRALVAALDATQALAAECTPVVHQLRDHLADVHHQAAAEQHVHPLTDPWWDRARGAAAALLALDAAVLAPAAYHRP